MLNNNNNNKKAKERNSREVTPCDQTIWRRSENPSKSYRGKPKVDTGDATRVVRMDSNTQHTGTLSWFGPEKVARLRTMQGSQRASGIRQCSLTQGHWASWLTISQKGSGYPYDTFFPLSEEGPGIPQAYSVQNHIYL